MIAYNRAQLPACTAVRKSVTLTADSDSGAGNVEGNVLSTSKGCNCCKEAGMKLRDPAIHIQLSVDILDRGELQSGAITKSQSFMSTIPVSELVYQSFCS